MSQVKQPLVTVITVVRNNSKYIRDAIESVLSQTYSEIEYVIVDGGSTDGTVNVINEYLDKISVFLSEHDDGIYDAMNKGVCLSSGDYIMFLNSDDYLVEKTSIEKAMSHFDSSLGALASNVVVVNRDGYKPIRKYPARRINTWLAMVGIMPPHQGFIISRKWFKKIGGFRIKYDLSADFDMLLRLYLNECPIKYLCTSLSYMRSGGESNASLRKILF